MKRLTLILIVIWIAVTAGAAIKIDKTEPAFWWSGMKNSELQILLYGPNIAPAQVATATPGVRVTKVVPAESPNYLFVYLDLKEAKAGFIDLKLIRGKEKKTIRYELKARTVDPESRRGFTTSDVLYLVMPDRFANGNPANDNLKMRYVTVNTDRADPNARHGGDMAGIEQHLDYISDLGVTAIWLNPVLENDMPGGSYHGYATTDYYNIDPRFGSNADYIRLIEKTHQKGMKVVMDMIFNHCGSEHIWMKDKPFADWFNFPDKYVQTNHAKNVNYDPYCAEYDKKKMFDGWFVETMPDLNQRNPHLARYLIQNSIWWVEYAGIDAIRQDTYPYADYRMMADWAKELMTEYPNFNMVGEAWLNYSPATSYWQSKSTLNKTGETYLKTVMDFPLTGIAHDAFHKETDWDNGLARIYEHLALDFIYPDVKNLLVFLENHDTDRFLTDMPKDNAVFKQAYTFLLTSRGIPQLYYGAEILMNGTKKESDGWVRRDFPGGWPGDATNAFVASGRTAQQNDAFDFLRKLLNWRKGNDVIAKGSLKHFAPRNGIYVYLREFGNKKVLVMLNGKSTDNKTSTEQYTEAIGSATRGRDVLTGRMVSLVGEIALSPRESLVLEIE